MRLLVTGSRTWGVVPKDCKDACLASTRARDQVDALLNALDGIHAATPVTELVNGGARGADTWAAWWARSHGIRIITVNAPFEELGPVAGTMRNSYMLDQHRPDLVVAFGRDTPGTENCVVQAKFRNIEVRRVEI